MNFATWREATPNQRRQEIRRGEGSGQEWDNAWGRLRSERECHGSRNPAVRRSSTICPHSDTNLIRRVSGSGAEGTCAGKLTFLVTGVTRRSHPGVAQQVRRRGAERPLALEFYHPRTVGRTNNIPRESQSS